MSELLIMWSKSSRDVLHLLHILREFLRQLLAELLR